MPRKVLVRLAAILGTTIALAGSSGCADANGEETSSSDGALRQGETSRAVVAPNVASLNPDATGIDTWRLSLVDSPTQGFIWVATGKKTGGDADGELEVVVTDTRIYLRSPSESIPLSVDSARAKALGDDVRGFATALTGAPADTSETSTASLRLQGDTSNAQVSPPAPSCLKDVGATAFVSAATVLFAGGGAILCTAGALWMAGVEVVDLGAHLKESAQLAGGWCNSELEPAIEGVKMSGPVRGLTSEFVPGTPHRSLRASAGQLMLPLRSTGLVRHRSSVASASRSW